MKKTLQLTMILAILFLLDACSEGNKESKIETFKNPVNTYMDSRVNTMENAKAIVAESNMKNKKQEDIIKTLLK